MAGQTSSEFFPIKGKKNVSIRLCPDMSVFECIWKIALNDTYVNYVAFFIFIVAPCISKIH